MKKLTKFFLILTFLDCFLTFILLSVNWGNGIKVYEANPIAVSIIQNYGWGGIVIYKIVYVLACVVCIQILPIEKYNFVYKLFWAICFLPGCAVILNTFVLFFILVKGA